MHCDFETHQKLLPCVLGRLSGTAAMDVSQKSLIMVMKEQEKSEFSA